MQRWGCRPETTGEKHSRRVEPGAERFQAGAACALRSRAPAWVMSSTVSAVCRAELHWPALSPAAVETEGSPGAPGGGGRLCEAVRRPGKGPRPSSTIAVGCQPAGSRALSRGDRLLRAMSRPSSVSPRPPARWAGAASALLPWGGRAKGLKDIRIDEEVEDRSQYRSGALSAMGPEMQRLPTGSRRLPHLPEARALGGQGLPHAWRKAARPGARRAGGEVPAWSRSPGM